eukprot:PhF_6_TR42151/c0_g1_i1/m.63694
MGCCTSNAAQLSSTDEVGMDRFSAFTCLSPFSPPEGTCTTIPTPDSVVDDREHPNTLPQPLFDTPTRTSLETRKMSNLEKHRPQPITTDTVLMRIERAKLVGPATIVVTMDNILPEHDTSGGVADTTATPVGERKTHSSSSSSPSKTKIIVMRKKKSSSKAKQQQQQNNNKKDLDIGCTLTTGYPTSQIQKNNDVVVVEPNSLHLVHVEIGKEEQEEGIGNQPPKANQKLQNGSLVYRFDGEISGAERSIA